MIPEVVGDLWISLDKRGMPQKANIMKSLFLLGKKCVHHKVVVGPLQNQLSMNWSLTIGFGLVMMEMQDRGKKFS